MQVGRSATYGRIRHAMTGGDLVNKAKKDERGMKLVLGAALPGDAESYLPTVEEVVRASSTRATGHANPHGETDSDALSGRPVRPAGTGDGSEPTDEAEVDPDDDIDFAGAE